MRVALKRAALVEALIGPDGAAEMRLERIAGADLRREPARASTRSRRPGFFAGPRAVLVEEAGDAAAPALKAALDDWRDGRRDAGGRRPATSSRRARCARPSRRAKSAVAIGVYDDPPGRDEIEAALAGAGLGRGRTARPSAAVEALAQALDPGDFAQFVAKLGLYKRGDPAPLDRSRRRGLRAAGRRGRGRRAGGARRRRRDRAAGGRDPAARRQPDGADHRRRPATSGRCTRRRWRPRASRPALARARPPVFGPKRARMAAQARAFGPSGSSRRSALIVDAELMLRSSRPVPAAALAERLLVRLAMLRRGRE